MTYAGWVGGGANGGGGGSWNSPQSDQSIWSEYLKPYLSRVIGFSPGQPYRDMQSGDNTGLGNFILGLSGKFADISNPLQAFGPNGAIANMQMPDWVSGPLDSLKSFGKSAYDFAFVPENQLQQAAPPPQMPGSFGAGATAHPETAPDGAGLPQSAGPSSTAELFSMPYNTPPAPPQLEAFQMPMPPAMQMPGPPPAFQNPDFTQANDWLAQAQPRQSEVDWKRERLRNMFAGLAQGAANWNSDSGLGGLIASAAAGGSAGIIDARSRELAAKDEFTKAMQGYALDRARAAIDQAQTVAGTKNKNAAQQYDYTVASADARNKHAVDVYNTQVSNLKAVHDANVTNSENMWKYMTDQAEATQPKVVSVTKDGVVIQRFEKGKQVLEHKQLKNADNSSHLKDIADAYGKDSTTYKMALFHDRLQTGDYLSVMQGIVKDAVENGYAEQIFPDKYEELKNQVMQNMNLNPGSKDYADAFAEAMARQLLQFVNIGDAAQMQQFARFGNLGAIYLLGGEQHG